MEIQHNTMPPKIHSCKDVQGNKTKYPWASMNVGDSFFVDSYSYKKQSLLIQNAKSWCDRNFPERKFTTRKENGGIRVYRIK
jgi:hypothetical protein